MLLPFEAGDLGQIVPEAQDDRPLTRAITMSRMRPSDGQELHAVNDLFIGPRSHVSARSTIQVGELTGAHSSSGIIASTGLGLTGWFRSILTGAIGIAGPQSSEELRALQASGFPWESQRLYYTVREPVPCRAKQASLVFGRIEGDSPLRITSQMPDYGVIFSDGLEQDFLESSARRSELPADVECWCNELPRHLRASARSWLGFIWVCIRK